MPRRSQVLGFTLIELVAIVVILGALAFFAMPRLRVTDSSLLTSRDAIIAAASHAQQIAMARDSAISLVVGANSVEVQENGTIVASPGADYPLTFPSGVAVTGGLGSLDYDKLGRTSATIISLNGGQVAVAVEASGYAH